MHVRSVPLVAWGFDLLNRIFMMLGHVCYAGVSNITCFNPFARGEKLDLPHLSWRSSQIKDGKPGSKSRERCRQCGIAVLLVLLPQQGRLHHAKLGQEQFQARAAGAAPGQSCCIEASSRVNQGHFDFAPKGVKNIAKPGVGEPDPKISEKKAAARHL